MTIQKILVPFLTTQAGISALEAGIVFAKHYKAHLDVVHLRRQLQIPAGSYYPIAASYIEQNVDALKKAQSELAADLKKLFTKIINDRGVNVLDDGEHDQSKGATAAWSDVDAKLAYDLATRARVADMVVMARRAGKTVSYEIDLMEDIIFQSGRPALVVDTEQELTAFPKTVMLAWDGGRESARAMSAALPVLKQADMVIVTTIGDMGWATEPPEHAAAFLKLHDVHATHLHARIDKKDDSAEVFLDHAEKKNADLVVMGAYSHHRWREVLLGGFTRHLLQNAQLPLLLSH